VFKNEVENQLEKTIKALRSDRGDEYISQEFKDYLKSCGIVQQLTPPYTPPYTPQHNGVSERRNLSGRAGELEEIQDEDTSPSEITSEVPMEVEGFEPPQEEDILIRRSERTRRAPNHLSLKVEVEEHSLGDLNEPTSYKAAMLGSESNNCKTIGSRWIFKKKTDMDGIVYTYKARLVAKGYTQLYGVDYEETFSPVTDIRAIRILISIAAYYDYEIWKMDIKTAFFNEIGQSD
ncbi:retrotransposon protein, putative, ty1-copia subclass, partial [Tanacetum coccineum]